MKHQMLRTYAVPGVGKESGLLYRSCHKKTKHILQNAKTMAAAAAVAGGMFRRRRQQVRREVEQTALQRQRLHERTKRYFAKLSDGGEWLMEDQVDNLLSLAMKDQEDYSIPHAVSLVIDTAQKSQRKAGLVLPFQDALAKDHLIQAVDMYGEYNRNREKVDGVFERFGKSDKGYLSKKGLWKALNAHERKASRSKKGISIRLNVSGQDVDWIMDEIVGCHNGGINRAEYLTCIALWESLAKQKLSEPSPCVIL